MSPYTFNIHIYICYNISLDVTLYFCEREIQEMPKLDTFTYQMILHLNARLYMMNP